MSRFLSWWRSLWGLPTPISTVNMPSGELLRIILEGFDQGRDAKFDLDKSAHKGKPTWLLYFVGFSCGRHHIETMEAFRGRFSVAVECGWKAASTVDGGRRFVDGVAVPGSTDFDPPPKELFWLYEPWLAAYKLAEKHGEVED